MDFFELIESRYSVRAYSNRPVEEEKLRQVLRAAQVAPTAANLQPFRLLVRETRGCQGDLGRLYHRDWFCQAPLIIGVCSVPGEGWVRRDGKNYADVDATIAMDHMILAAAALGLGTCWIAAFDPAVARSVFDLPQGVEPLAFTPLGYPADQAPKERPRKALRELIWSQE
jgi:nitroreductase